MTDPDERSPGRGDGGLVASALLCAARCVRVLTRSPVAVVQGIIFPTLLLLTIMAAFGRTIGGSTSAYAERLVPQLVISAGALGAIGTGLLVHHDRSTGMIDRIRAMPVASSAHLWGVVLADALRALAGAAVIVAVGHLLGFRFDRGAVAAVAFFVVAVAFSSIFAWFSVAAGLRAEHPEAIGSLLNGPVLMMFFLSTGFVTVEGFPAGAQPLVRFNPLSCAVNLMLGLSESGPVLVPFLQTVAWIVGLGGVLALIAIRSFGGSTGAGPDPREQEAPGEVGEPHLLA